MFVRKKKLFELKYFDFEYVRKMIHNVKLNGISIIKKKYIHEESLD